MSKSINERIDALMVSFGIDPRDGEIPIKLGTKRNVVVGGNGYLGQRFPVTLYAPSWLWFLREENIHAILEFLETQAEHLSWGKD